ncbi:hypothetical protein C1645_804003 [Glomus cerebriforme]|uniref:Uncharacterized protein n=1 Tax=Glomus cerebriforme TaxID=658196 RepID=A0A397TFD5_9GLOM|nr:hypothetical protein C1645_804003 [Glomus cerebriforme]
MEPKRNINVTVSGTEKKNLSILDKTEKGSSRVDTSASAVPMKMSKPNKTRVEKHIMSPPRSVSFDLSKTILSIPKESYSNCFAASPADSLAESLDISVRDCSEEIFVALVERDTEMRELVELNKDFFDTIKQCIFEDEKKWEDFLKVLYSKREEKPDSEWMESISEFLSDNPPFLVSFKQIIGYYENYDDDVIQEDYDYYDDDDDHTSESCVINEPTYIDITPIRNFPNVLENLEKSYPQFFINAKNEIGKLGKDRSRRGSTLGRNHLNNDNPLLHPNIEDQPSEDSSETLYDELNRILITPRSVMNDFEWETAINECLDAWPQLLLQLEDILIHEIEANYNSIEE